MAEKQYINIIAPYTLNTHLDEVSSERPAGHFSILKNYIPDEDILLTREGITVFTHTPATTIPTTYDPLTDPGAIIWMRFEDGPSAVGGVTVGGTAVETFDDEIQGAYWWWVTASNTYSASPNQMEGNASFYSDYYTLGGNGTNTGIAQIYTSLESIGCPGYVDGKHTFIMTIWVRPTYLNSANKTFYLGRTEYTQPGGWYLSIQTGSGTNHFAASVTNSAGVTRTFSASTAVVQGQWYHVALWSSENVGNSGLVIYDDTNGTETAVKSSPAVVNAGQYSSMASLTRSMLLTSTYRAGRGHLDDFIVTLNVPAQEALILEKIRSMRDENRLAGTNDFSGDSDVVALWRFENNYTDSIGSYDLTGQNSPTFVSYSYEGLYCLELSAASSEYAEIVDGSLDAVMPGKSGESEKDFSICCWIKPYSFNTSTQGIVAKWEASANLKTWALALTSAGVPRWQIGDGVNTHIVTSDFSLSIDTWYHLGATYKASDNSMVLRIRRDDGTLMGGANQTETSLVNMAGTNTPIWIGKMNAAANNYFDGLVDEVVIINRVLTNTEIDNIYNGAFS